MVDVKHKKAYNMVKTYALNKLHYRINLLDNSTRKIRKEALTII